MIALKSVAENGTAFDRYYFIELVPELADELEAAIAELKPTAPAEVIRGDVNVELPNLMKKIHQRSPTFILLDTEGIEPSWRTIEALASWRTELLINFPLGMGINRNVGSEKVTRYFGTDDWRPVWQASRPGEAKGLIDLYKNRLGSLGWKYPSALDRPIKTLGGQSLYFLIHVSKVKAAQSIMRWVAKQPDFAGQTRMGFDFPEDEG